MDRILYVLTGISLAGVFVVGFVAKVEVTKINSTDFIITIAFLVLLAAGSFAFHASPWGRRIKNWFDAADDRERIKARDEGTVRQPPWWNVWP